MFPPSEQAYLFIFVARAQHNGVENLFAIFVRFRSALTSSLICQSTHGIGNQRSASAYCFHTMS
jgi:hypothetical protein